MRAFEGELGVQAPVGFWDPLGLSADGSLAHLEASNVCLDCFWAGKGIRIGQDSSHISISYFFSKVMWTPSSEEEQWS